MRTTKEKEFEALNKKLRGKVLGYLDIRGKNVQIVRNESDKNVWFCAYVTLKNSSILNDSALSHPTMREGDIVGVDTAHAYNMQETESEKLLDAINQIDWIIKQAGEILKEV